MSFDCKFAMNPPETLGEWQRFSTFLFGEDSPATEFLNKKMEEQGENEIVIAPYSQVLYLLYELHQEKELK